jgi:hypothetical protein
MIKSELVTRLAERYPHLYHRDVERIVSTVLDEIAAALAGGDRVELRGSRARDVIRARESQYPWAKSACRSSAPVRNCANA